MGNALQLSDIHGLYWSVIGLFMPNAELIVFRSQMKFSLKVGLTIYLDNKLDLLVYLPIYVVVVMSSIYLVCQ